MRMDGNQKDSENPGNPSLLYTTKPDSQLLLVLLYSSLANP